jgi:hypothetical protein
MIMIMSHRQDAKYKLSARGDDEGVVHGRVTTMNGQVIFWARENAISYGMRTITKRARRRKTVL